MFLFIIVITSSCMSFKAKISDISEEEQLIDVKIYKVSFDNIRPLVERIILNIYNKSNSTIIIIPGKSYFQDNKGFHDLRIQPLNIKANTNVNVPIESIDYYETESSFYSYGYFSSGSSKAKMQDLNVKYLEIFLSYKSNNNEYIGIYRIDVK